MLLLPSVRQGLAAVAARAVLEALGTQLHQQGARLDLVVVAGGYMGQS